MAVESFLSASVLSLDNLISAVRTQSLDANSANPVFSDSQIKLALRHAIAHSVGKFHTTDFYDLSFTSGTFEYTLPADIQRIIGITRERPGIVLSSLNTLTGLVPNQDLGSWRHSYSRALNKLTFYKDFPSATFTIWYERDVTIPIDTRTVSGSHTSVITTLTLTDTSPYLYQVALPAYFLWGSEIIKVTAFTSNTSATMARGQLGTTAASHSSGTTISQIIMADQEAFYDYIFAKAGQMLNLWRVQAGNQSVSVAANVTAERLLKEDAETLLQRAATRRRSRRMKFSNPRRPRRAL